MKQVAVDGDDMDRSSESKGEALAEKKWKSVLRVIVTGAALALGGVVLVLIVLWAPQRIVDGSQARSGSTVPISTVDRLAAENNVRTTLITAFGGVILLLGIVFTTRQLRISREQVSASWVQQSTTRKISEASLEATRKAQQGETLSRAVDQLGGESITTRLGGVASLDLLATEDGRLRDLTMEILCAFIRSSSPASFMDDVLSSEDEGGDEVGADGNEDSRSIAERLGIPSWAVPRRQPGADIQLALTVLGRLRGKGEDDVDKLLDIQYRSLLNLDSAGLAGARLATGNFDGATFRRADLYGANLSGGRFHGAVFFLANCSEGNFCGDFFAASFDQTFMSECDFHAADLRHASFQRAYLVGARFVKADVRGADFTGAQLHFDGADHARFELARADATTVWPEGFDPVSAGVVVDK